MGDVVQVEPREGSYLNEWRAVQYAVGDWQVIKRLLRPLGFHVWVDLADESGPVLVVLRGLVTLYAAEEDWIVISPHDKVIIMDHLTYVDQFMEVVE